MQEWRRIFLLFAASCFMLLPAIIKGIPRGNDLDHHYRASIGLYEAIDSKQFHPGWNSLPTEGYGDVCFRFYPPLFYYVMGLTRALTGNWYSGSFLAFLLLLFVGGLGVYFWAKNLLPDKLAFCAALLFLLSPYHLNQLYQASLLAEYAGCAVLPFSFAFVERLCQKANRRDVLGLAASYAILILTHLPLTVIGSLSLAIYGLFRLRRSDYLKTLCRLSVAVLLGLAASSFYWVTMVAELAWMRGNKVNPQLWYDYRYNFLLGPELEGSTSWWATLLAGATLLTLLPAFVLLKNKQGQKPKKHPAITAAFMLTGFSFFMMLPLSRPVWDMLSFLQQVEFPWRWLTITSVLCPILTAASLPEWVEIAKSKFRPLALLAVGSLSIAVAFTVAQIIGSATYLQRSDFDLKIEVIASTPSSSDMLPIWATTGPQKIAGAIEAPDRQFEIISWQAQHRAFQVDAGHAQEARTRTYYYPHWIATTNGKRLETRADTDGTLLIALPNEAVNVELTFCEPPRVALANTISLISWLALAACGFRFFFQRMAQTLRA
jgi:uncharacterized membrane protein